MVLTQLKSVLYDVEWTTLSSTEKYRAYFAVDDAFCSQNISCDFEMEFLMFMGKHLSLRDFHSGCLQMYPSISDLFERVDLCISTFYTQTVFKETPKRVDVFVKLIIFKEEVRERLVEEELEWNSSATNIFMSRSIIEIMGPVMCIPYKTVTVTHNKKECELISFMNSNQNSSAEFMGLLISQAIRDFIMD